MCEKLNNLCVSNVKCFVIQKAWIILPVDSFVPQVFISFFRIIRCKVLAMIISSGPSCSKGWIVLSSDSIIRNSKSFGVTYGGAPTAVECWNYLMVLINTFGAWIITFGAYFILLLVTRKFHSIKLICRNQYSLFSHVKKPAYTVNQKSELYTDV